MYYKHIEKTWKESTMKISNIFKYIFIIFAVGIIVYAGYRIYKTQNAQTNTQEEPQVVEEENIIKDIRLALTNYDTMNPLITSNKEILNIDTLIFEPLFSLTKNYEIEPCLAKECAKTGNNIYVIKLKEGIVWQNGTPFTAEDVKYTIETINQGNSIYKYNTSHIATVEIVDTNTVKLTLDADVPFFSYNLIFPIVSSEYYKGEDFFTSTKTPIGTGKFTITNISTNNITLAKNTKYRELESNPIKIDTIKINLYSSMGEAYSNFKMGNIDLLDTSNPNFQDYIGTIGFEKTEYAGRQFDFLSLNCEDIILQDKAVRQAISYAIDKSNINSAIFNNQNYVAEYPLDYGNFLYETNNASSGCNPEQAKKVLEDGGWTYTNNRWKKEIEGVTRTLRLKIAVDKDNQTRIAVSELIKEQLESIGIEVRINKISKEQYNEYIGGDEYQILFTGVYTSYNPDITYYFAPGNIEKYTNEEVSKLLQNAGMINDGEKIKEIYQKVYNIYKEDVPFIGLYRTKEMVVTSSSLVGSVEANCYTSFYEIKNWYRK